MFQSSRSSDEMPKTKARSAPRPEGVTKAKGSSRKKNNNVPSLSSLSADIERNIDQLSLESPTPFGNMTTIPENAIASTKKNLRELFSEEDTVVIVEDVSLRGKKQPGQAVENARKAERMDIFLRVRPFLVNEISKGENMHCFSVLPERKGIAFNPPASSSQYRRLANSQNGKIGYEFTQVLGDELNQKEVFEITMRKPIQQFLCETSQLIFTYGVTNSGKTYTLLGPRNSPGILPRALERIFAAVGDNVSRDITLQPYRYEDIVSLDAGSTKEAMKRRETYLAMKSTKYMKNPEPASQPVTTPTPSSSFMSDTTSLGSVDSHGFFDFRPASQAEDDIRHDRDCVDRDGTYLFWVSFIEIYEDVMYDLLDVGGGGTRSGRVLRSATVKLCDEPNVCYPRGLVEIPVFSAAEAYHILGLGRKNLHVAATKLNEASSRSHSVFTIRMIKSKGREATVTQLSFCDLAGTERAYRTENLGTRLKESQNINKDLHHLKECIEALRKTTAATSKGRKKDLVPYRNCKLTRLFRSFFSGKGTASMIVNISQCASDFDETVHAIRFGSSALRIMIPMTRRESLLIQTPQFDGPPENVHQNVMSVALEDLQSIYEENDDTEDGDSDNDSISATPSTVKKQPQRARKDIGNETVVLKGRKEADPDGTPVSSSNGRPKRATATRKAPSTVKRNPRKTRVIGPAPNEKQLDEASSSGTSTSVETEDESSTTSDAESRSKSVSSSADEGSNDVEEDDEDLNEAEVTLGGAVRGSYTIPDRYWEQNCPFPQHIFVDDQRIRALLLLLGEIQSQFKLLKAQSATNEMKVRKELCDFYEKERMKHAREHGANIRRLEREFAEDLDRQLKLQKENIERQHAIRRDSSLINFEGNEDEIEKEELLEEIRELKERVKELEAGDDGA